VIQTECPWEPEHMCAIIIRENELKYEDLQKVIHHGMIKMNTIAFGTKMLMSRN